MLELMRDCALVMSKLLSGGRAIFLVTAMKLQITANQISGKIKISKSSSGSSSQVTRLFCQGRAIQYVSHLSIYLVRPLWPHYAAFVPTCYLIDAAQSRGISATTSGIM
jgi:hypothetical protein